MINAKRNSAYFDPNTADNHLKMRHASHNQTFMRANIKQSGINPISAKDSAATQHTLCTKKPQAQ